MKDNKLYGLLGKGIDYSFSKTYFTNKFDVEKFNCQYENIDVAEIGEFLDYLANNIERLQGFNITIPYKENIFQFLDEVDEVAEEIGAVNCVKIIDGSYLKGYNTDAYGFEESLKTLLKKPLKALIFGTGGASKAIAYTFKKLKIEFKFVSRNPKENQLSYEDITKEKLQEYLLLINTTPLGTKNKLENEVLNIPFTNITAEHILYDLVYNPAETLFLKKGKENNAVIKNGLEMLELQADKSWEIWNES